MHSPVQDQAGHGSRANEEPSASFVLEDLLKRAKTLLSELEDFRARLRELRQDGKVELGHFRGTIQSELDMLERLSKKAESEQTKHVARSSNVPFWERVWSTVKKSRDVVALRKRIYMTSNKKLLSQGMRHLHLDGPAKGRLPRKGEKESAVIVDAITDGGKTWTKVSLVTNQRLLHDLAKQGWDSGGSEDEDEEVGFAQRVDDDHDVPLVKTAKELTHAASCFRVRTRTPKIHLVLPRIIEGETAEVDRLLNECRAAGAVLYCGDELRPELAIQDALKTMVSDPLESFSEVLNIDCTILLALVSEFSHAKVEKAPWFHTALKRQVEIEDNEKLLPSLLYPAMGSHRVVCTQEAVKRMREIVDTIGTPSERARTKAMLGDDTSKTRTELIQEMQEWSAYPVPEVWQLPIQIVDQNENDCLSRLPPQALEASKEMTDINRSVFLHGWASGRTTITSNRTVTKNIEADLERHADLPDTVWPSIWLCPTARSLVGKEKRGAKKLAEGAAKECHTAWPLPDPLRREEQRRNGLDVLSRREGHAVEDLRPQGYPCEEVLAAKNASLR
ncbi:hypothetical protein B0A50_03797 [Salinomyces thailandicus]|uniref:DUF1308 domain-containing protein n=1 Tax=Salinomyces thailandicus TaxID=706561 RepID=A0A4U0U328_9PEZI|nr:hypothetical protein B0A50_03797 [Salinomyces thailandica]